MVIHLIAEWRWGLGSTYWGPKHHVWYCTKLYYFEIAWWTRGWNGSCGKSTEVDLGSWWCNCNHFMGKNVAFSMNSISILLYCAEKGNVLKILANLWLIFTGFRYLECTNGLGIIHCRQKYGFALTFSHVIQVSNFLVILIPWTQYMLRLTYEKYFILLIL